MSDGEICFLEARELARHVRERTLSAREVVEAHLRQIERLNPQLNAIVTLVAESALEAADSADAVLARGDAVGPLHGLPIAVKDLVLTQGIRTTYGSPVLKDYVPDHDALIVERMKAAGAIVLGKTNAPEFGAGSQTYNEVFGATLNPYDLTRTCGGSSGGAAVALACGMQPLADGSDQGGSLRNPASFCNVVGLRPSPGRVPSWPSQAAWYPITVEGPMARTVADAALLLSVLAGPDPRSPIAIPESGRRFAEPLGREFAGVRLAWSRTLGGLPVDRRVTAVLEAQRPVFEELGCHVEDAEPDLEGADDIFRVWRAWSAQLNLHGLYEAAPELIKETLRSDIERGQTLTGPELGRAERDRSALYHRLRIFLEEREFLLAPVTQVPPFDVKEPWVREIEGVPLESYIDWMRSCSAVSVTGLPAISVPCGFTPEGLPVGLQIVGRHQDDWGVLQLAHAFESATGFWRRRPALCAS